MIPGGSLSTHLLATLVRVMGKTYNITASCDTSRMLNKLTISKTRSTCSWASSFLFSKKVMAALVSSISLDLSNESVRSSILQVILIGSISVKVPVSLEVRAAEVASLVEVLELDTHSSSEADPSESSLPPVSVVPMVSPFLSLNDSKLDTEMLESHVLPITHDAMLARQDIPISQLYRTHPGGPCRALTTRNSVRPLLSYHLTLRYTSHYLDRFTFGSSSDHSSSDHSSSGHSISSHSVCGHTPLVITITDSSTPLRFVYPPVARTSWYSKAYRHWRSAPLSTIYPPTTFDSSARDSSSESSAGPSRKRCRSHTAPVISSIHNLRALVLSFVDLDDAMAVKVAADMDILARVDAGIGMKIDARVDVEDEVEGEAESSDRGTIEVGVNVVARIDILDGMLMPDAMECLKQVEGLVKDIYRQVMEIHLKRVEDIKMGQRELEVRCLISSEERVGLLDRVASLERSNTRL
nr:hypothetical protein [Tanacetum cinerariifolium]